jgi:TonB-linked SusC/RagA family outer membrane protein
MKKLILSLFVLVMVAFNAIAQDRRITGTVTSQENDPIPGVSVKVNGGKGSAVTDENGKYVIVVGSSTTALTFSYLGMVEQTKTIGSSTTINVTLLTDQKLLAEVIVTGYSNIKKSEFTGAATVLTAETVENKPVGSFTQLLQGRAPGLLANSGSGQPGNNATITIRGIKSISGAGAQPLYVIDGVPTSAGDFEALNPNDFETITVLKDANAAAMYGSRAGTGAIVITTKQGKAGTSQIGVRVQTGITAAPDFSRLNLMSTAELLAHEEFVGLATGSTNAAFGVPGWVYSRKNPANANATPAQLAQYDRLLDSTRNINTDIADLLFRTGVSQTYEVDASGGNENTRYFASLGYFDQDGIDRTSGLKRYSARLNLNHTKNKFKMQWNTTLGYSIQGQAVGDLYGNSALNPFQMIYRAKPYDNPYLADGTLNFGGGGGNLNLKSLANVLESNISTRQDLKRMKVNSGLTLSYEILPNLILKNTSGLDASNLLNTTYINPDSFRGAQQINGNSGYAREGNTITSQLINTTALNYSFKLTDQHKFGVGAYFEAVRAYNKGMGFLLYNLNKALPWTGQGAAPIPTQGAATYPQNASSASSGYGIRSFFGTLNYAFDDKVSANVNIRRDGTSRIINPENREIISWSAGAAWNVINHDFMKNQTFLTDLKLRGSFGIVPNIGSITTGGYTISGSGVTNYASAQVPSFSATSYPGSTVAGLAPSTPGNGNLRIENVEKLNIGLDVAAFRNRLRLSVDAYDEKTKDLFVSQPLSATSGFGSLAINAGQMSNKGLEFDLKFDVVKSNKFGITVGANHAINVNNIDDLGLVEEYFLGTFVIRKDLPYGSHYNPQFLGVEPSNGRPIYRTNTGTTNDVAQANSYAEAGTYLPKHVGGFTFDLNYKGFYTSALFSYQFDVHRSNNTRNWITDGTTGYVSAVNQSRELIGNVWTKPGDIARFPSPRYAKGFTDFDIQDAKFLRFRSLDFGYMIPEIRSNGKAIVKNARIYANFQNLAIWSPWSGVDPEDNNNISLVEYPNPKMVVFGIDFKF